jgi:WD40 domain-containing protein/WD40 repeat protein
LLLGQESRLRVQLQHSIPIGQPIRATEVSPDGRFIAASFKSGTIKLIDPATAQILTTIETGQESPDIAISPDSQLLASIGRGPVKVWKAQTGSLKAEISDGLEEFGHGPAFSPDGRTLAAWSGDLKIYQSRLGSRQITASPSGQIRIWNLETGRVTLSLRRFNHFVWSLRFSPDGKLLASVGAVGWKLWDAQTGELIREHFDRHDMSDPIFLAGATQLAVCSGDKIKIFNTNSGKEFRALKHEAGISALATNNDKLLISAGKDGKLKFWDAASGQLRYTLDAHEDVVSDMALSADGKTLVSAGSNGVLKIWGLE